MRNVSRFAAIVLAAAGLGLFVVPTTRGDATTQPSSDTQAATGSVTGTVMMDGKPVANARVGLIDASQMKAHNGKRNKNQTGADATQTGGQTQDQTQTQPQAQGQKRERPTPTATAMTDSDGKFTMSDVKVGEYVVMAAEKGQGRGRMRISVASGETATVEIQLAQAPVVERALQRSRIRRHGRFWILDLGLWIEIENAASLKSKIRNPKSQMTLPWDSPKCESLFHAHWVSPPVESAKIAGIRVAGGTTVELAHPVRSEPLASHAPGRFSMTLQGKFLVRNGVLVVMLLLLGAASIWGLWGLRQQVDLALYEYSNLQTIESAESAAAQGADAFERRATTGAGCGGAA